VKGTLRWLAANLGIILLSLLLAGVVWAVAVEEENPTIEQRYPSAIPVTMSEPPEGTIAYGQTDDQVYITLRAPESVWNRLQVTDFYAAVDLSGLEEGVHHVPVQVEVDQRPVRVQQIEPEAITVHLERLSQTLIPVNVHIEGNTALGYIAQPPVVSTLTTTVSGPASPVGQVVTAVAYVSVAGGRADIEGVFDLEPHDAEGKVVPYVTLSPNQVAVHVPIEQLSGFQDVAVTAILEGQVAPGYRISSVTVNPPIVTVFGSPEAITQIPGYLEATPLDIEGAKADIETRLPLVTPEGISLLMDDPVVTVRVSVVPLEGSVTLQREVELQGLSPGMTATVAPEMVEVILSGPLAVLEQLQDTDVRVIADLFGLTAGSTSVTPQVVVVPPEVIAESVLPAGVQVEITAQAVPTPGR